MVGWWKWISGSFSEFLYYIGLHRKQGKLVIIGLDNAGKTTLIRRLKEGTMSTPIPTWFATKEELSIGRVSFTAFDIGGHQQVRRVWYRYFFAVDAVVFVVDASDHQRLPEACEELNSVLTNSAVADDVPILLLGNKIDQPGAASEDELRHLFGLHGRATGKTVMAAPRDGGPRPRPLELFMCSVLKEQGYGEALRWLLDHL